MKPILFAAAVVLSLAGARSSHAQTAVPAVPVAPDAPSVTYAPAADTLAERKPVKLSAATDSALRELERAAAELARTVEETVRKTADDPALRITAMKLASGAVAIAQQTLVENVNVLEQLLAEAARQIASAQVAQEAKAAAKKKQ